MFNLTKFRFARQEVEFAGFLITDKGIKPVAKYTEAIIIKEFPTHSNISEVQAWYGLVYQVTYCFCKTAVMAPFRHLLSPATEFACTDELDEAFDASKAKIIDMIKIGF